MLILNEEAYAKKLYDRQNADIKSVVTLVGYITRYQLHALHYSDEDNYKYTVEWMTKYHGNFDESYYSNLIADAIKKAHKNDFYHMESIQITKSELEIISSLDNLRAEKVLFVLLCMAKQQSVAYGFVNGLVKYSLPSLCKEARISVPSDEREYILYNIVQCGFLGYPKKNNTQCLIVNFINNDDEVVLNLSEVDCQELAYVYLNWKNNGEGYGRCAFCSRLIKQSKKNTKRFCEACSTKIGDIADNEKVILCTDCGDLVYVSIYDSATCRCGMCQSEEVKRLKREWWSNNKNVKKLE